MTDKLSCRAPETARGGHGAARAAYIAAVGAGLLMLSGTYAGAQTQERPKNLLEFLTRGLTLPAIHSPTPETDTAAETATAGANASPNSEIGVSAPRIAPSRLGARNGRPGRGLIFRSRNGKRIKKAVVAPTVLTELGTSPAAIQSQDTVDAIRTSIQRYKAIAASGGWKSVPAGRAPRKGERSATVLAVALRLNMTGDLKSRPSKSPAFDNTLVAALKRFQVRHGLPPSGLLNKDTRTEMNVDVATRIAQLEINLKRVVKLIRGRMPKRFVMVNIPGYEIEAVSDGTVDMRQRVVLGRPSRKTPVLKTNITQLNFLPYWHAPQSIVRKDLIPILKKSTKYLTTSNMKVYKVFGGKEIDPETVDWSSPEAAKLKFRQEPGPRNALGYLRLNMPNRYAVFLHDTPQKNLFLDDVRAFSSGCVRVQNIPVFAEWLAKNNEGWDQARILETFEAGKRKDLTLRKPVPVYFSYVTAWATPQGTVQFRRDIYNKDGLMEYNENGLMQMAAINADAKRKGGISP